MPVLATNLQTHTQVVNTQQAMLCDPTPEAMASAMTRLIESDELRRETAANAKRLIDEHHSIVGFRTQMLEIYQTVLGPRNLTGGSEAL